MIGGAKGKTYDTTLWPRVEAEIRAAGGLGKVAVSGDTRKISGAVSTKDIAGQLGVDVKAVDQLVREQRIVNGADYFDLNIQQRGTGIPAALRLQHGIGEEAIRWEESTSSLLTTPEKQQLRALGQALFSALASPATNAAKRDELGTLSEGFGKLTQDIDGRLHAPNFGPERSDAEATLLAKAGYDLYSARADVRELVRNALERGLLEQLKEKGGAEFYRLTESEQLLVWNAVFPGSPQAALDAFDRESMALTIDNRNRFGVPLRLVDGESGGRPLQHGISGAAAASADFSVQTGLTQGEQARLLAIDNGLFSAFRSSEPKEAKRAAIIELVKQRSDLVGGVRARLNERIVAPDVARDELQRLFEEQIMLVYGHTNALRLATGALDGPPASSEELLERLKLKGGDEFYRLNHLEQLLVWNAVFPGSPRATLDTFEREHMRLTIDDRNKWGVPLRLVEKDSTDISARSGLTQGEHEQLRTINDALVFLLTSSLPKETKRDGIVELVDLRAALVERIRGALNERITKLAALAGEAGAGDSVQSSAALLELQATMQAVGQLAQGQSNAEKLKDDALYRDAILGPARNTR